MSKRLVVPKMNLVTVGLMTAAGLAVVLSPQPSTSAPPTSPLDACVQQYTGDGKGALGKGQQRIVTPAGTVVGGRISVKSSSEQDAGTEGTEASMEIAVDDGAMDYEAYEAQGRSVLKDAKAAGVAPGLVRKLCADALAAGTLKLVAMAGDGRIYDSICAHDDSDAFEWDACVIRYKITEDGDPDFVYGIDDTQGYGHETEWWPWLGLVRGQVENHYLFNDIIKASPSSDITGVENCQNIGFSVGYSGTSVSASGNLCPDRWEVSRPDNTGETWHRVAWRGWKKDSNRESNALTLWRRTAYSTFSPNYSLRWRATTGQDTEF